MPGETLPAILRQTMVIHQLELTPSDRVLEIGFGGGVSLQSLIEGAAFVCVRTVDRS